MFHGRFLRIATAALLAGGVAFAQGAGSGSTKKTIAEELRSSATAGPGFIQSEFVSDLSTGLSARFGEERSKEMLDRLGQSGLDSQGVCNLMNGQTTTSGLQDLLGARRSELPGVEEALGEAVDGKNKKMFFGIMIFVMVVEFDVDADAEFCRQAFGAQGEMSKESFTKLTRGNVSTNTIGDAFGFQDKSDCKFMQEIMNAMMSSMFMQHPMCASLGMGGGQPLSEEQMQQFPQLGEGMPGFPAPGSGLENGTAGGLPFDKEMPPCPFAGGNLKEFFAPPEEAGSE